MKRNINKIFALLAVVFVVILASCKVGQTIPYTMQLGYFPEDSEDLEAVVYPCTLEGDMYVFQGSLNLGKVSSGAFIEAEVGTLETHPYVFVMLQTSSGTRKYASNVWNLSEVEGNVLRCEYWNCLSGGSPDGTLGINGVMINELTKDAMNRSLLFDFSLQPYWIFKVSREVSSKFIYEIRTNSDKVFAIGSDDFNDIVRYNTKKQLKNVNINPSYGDSLVSNGCIYYDTDKNLIENTSDYYILVFGIGAENDAAFSICLSDAEWIDSVSEYYKISEDSSLYWDGIKSADVDGKLYFTSRNTNPVLRSYDPKEKVMNVEKVFSDNISSVVSYGKEVFVSTAKRDTVNDSNYTNNIYSYNTVSGETHLLKTIVCKNSIDLFISDGNLVFLEGREGASINYNYYVRSLHFTSSTGITSDEALIFTQTSYYIKPVILYIENEKVYFAEINSSSRIVSIEINSAGEFGSKSGSLVTGFGSTEALSLRCPITKVGDDILCHNTGADSLLLKENAGKYDRTESPVNVTKFKAVTEFDGKLFAFKNEEYKFKADDGKEYKIYVNGSDSKNMLKLMSLSIYDSSNLQLATETMKKGYYSDTIGFKYNEESTALEAVTYGMDFVVQGDTLYLVAMEVPLIDGGDCLVSFIPVWSKASDWTTTLEGSSAKSANYRDNTNMKFDSSFMVIED